MRKVLEGARMAGARSTAAPRKVSVPRQGAERDDFPARKALGDPERPSVTRAGSPQAARPEPPPPRAGHTRFGPELRARPRPGVSAARRGERASERAKGAAQWKFPLPAAAAAAAARAARRGRGRRRARG